MPAIRYLAIVSGLLLPLTAQAAPHHRPARVQTATYRTPAVKHRPHARMASHAHQDHLAQLHRHAITRGS